MRHRQKAKAAGQQLPSRPTATAPVVDSTAGAGRQMADGDRDPEFVGQALAVPASTGADATPLLPPQSAVISSRVAVGIAGGAELVPPAADALDGEHRGVVADADD